MEQAGLAAAVPAAQRPTFISAVAGSALALRLHERGWTLRSGVGRPLEFERGNVTIAPFTLVPQMLAGALTAESWGGTCTASGLAALVLVPVEARGDSPPIAFTTAEANPSAPRTAWGTMVGLSIALAGLVHVIAGIALVFPGAAVFAAARRAAGQAATRAEIAAAVVQSPAGLLFIVGGLLLTAYLTVLVGYASTRTLRGRSIVPAALTGIAVVLNGAR